MPSPDDEELLRAAFRDVHATRLHGFVLLVALGDRQAAFRAANQALAEGAERVHELRHPERAAAWLRGRALRSLGRGRRSRPTPDVEALQPLGVTAGALVALGSLSVTERAALIASDVERMAPIDLELVLGTGQTRARRIVVSARRRYVEAVASGPLEVPADGPLTQRVLLVAARTFPQPTRLRRLT